MEDIVIKIISNGSKWAGQEPDTIEELLNALNRYTLDPTFEKYGNFVNSDPVWLKPEVAEKYKGCTVIFGNFIDCSHVFRIVTDDAEIIAALSEAIERNKETAEYKTFKKELFDSEQKKLEARKLFNEGKIKLREMYAMYE
jgi:hypothetical protein